MSNRTERETRQLLEMVLSALRADSSPEERNYVQARIEKWLEDNRPLPRISPAKVRKWK